MSSWLGRRRRRSRDISPKDTFLTGGFPNRQNYLQGLWSLPRVKENRLQAEMTKEHGFWRRCGYGSFVCRDLLDGKVSFEKISWRQRGGHLLNMKLEEALKFSGPRLLSKKLSEKNFSNVFSPFFYWRLIFWWRPPFPKKFSNLYFFL